MDVFDFPFALLTFLALVAVVPPWVWFVNNYGPTASLSLPSQFLAALILPATILLALTSWVEGGART
jgi:hypothetical protein